MVLGDLIGTPSGAASSTGSERTLTVTAQGAAAPGALLVLLGTSSLILTVLLHGLTADAVLGGGGLAVGGVLWVVAQGYVARWISERRPRTLMVATLCGLVAVLTTWLGWGIVVGFSWIPVGVAAVVVLVESILVATIDPGWRARATGAGAVESVPGMDEALVLRWLALAALSLGAGAGAAVTLQFFHYVLHWEEDWNLIGAYASVYLFAAVAAWCAPQLALLAWAGGRVRSGVPVIVLGAGVWAAAIWAASVGEGLGLLIPLLVGAVVVLEVVVGCMIVWRRFG